MLFPPVCLSAACLWFRLADMDICAAERLEPIGSCDFPQTEKELGYEGHCEIYKLQSSSVRLFFSLSY